MKLLRSLFTMPVLTVFSLALLIRYLYNTWVARDYFPLHDSLTYQSIAYNILRDHCYCLLPHLQTVDRAPLWPVLIALVYSVLGPHDRIVRLLLCVVGSGTCVLIYFFVKDLFGKRVGLCIGLLATIYPFLFIYDGWLYSESVYTFLLLAFCYVLYHQQRTPRWSLAILSGILLGLLSLTRPNGLLILSLCIVWAVVLGWRKLLSWRVVVQMTLAVSLISLALIAPWTVRNFAVTHTLVPVAVGDGKVLLGAYNDMVLQRPYYLGIWIIPSESVPAVAQQFPENCADACEVRRDNTYRYYAEQWILSHLHTMPYLLGLHLVNMWQVTSQEADLAINRFPERDTSYLVVAMMEVLTPIVFALAALGLLVTRRYWHELLLIYLMIALTIVQCIVLYGIPRFRAPIEPMLLILAGGALRWLASVQQGVPKSFKDSLEPPVEMCIKKTRTLYSSLSRSSGSSLSSSSSSSQSEYLFVEDSLWMRMVGWMVGNGRSSLRAAGPSICGSYGGAPSRTSTSSPIAIDSKPRRRRSITIPGHVSSAAIAHHSRPMTRTSLTRTGRLRSPKLASRDVRFRSALLTIINRPFFN